MKRVILALMAVMVLGSTLVADTPKAVTYQCKLHTIQDIVTGETAYTDGTMTYVITKGHLMAVTAVDGERVKRLYTLNYSKTHKLTKGYAANVDVYWTPDKKRMGAVYYYLDGGMGVSYVVDGKVGMASPCTLVK